MFSNAFSFWQRQNSPCGLGIIGVPGPGGPAEPGGPYKNFMCFTGASVTYV